MYINKLKEKLENKDEMALVIMIKGYAPLVEIAGIAGFDAILLEAEHSSISQSESESLITVSEAADIIPMVRARKNEAELILRYLDAGAMGILVPNIKTKEDAEKAVESVKYHPMGTRGLAPTRAADYGMSMPLKDYVKFANQQTLVLVMIENEEAVDNIEEIVKVEGLDGVVIGFTDLSQSLGFPGEANKQIVQDAVEKVKSAVLKTDLILGAPAGPDSDIKDFYKQGYRMIFVDALGFYKKGVLDFISSTKTR